ncbi:MAG: D-alanine--D-alanine ligase [Magnetococcus sp. WYHC-3]
MAQTEHTREEHPLTGPVAVLMGGMSEERDISLKSGTALYQALLARGYDAVAVDCGRDLPQRLLTLRPRAAVIALHGPLGEDGTVQGLLEVMGIPYTGSGVTASAVCMNKALCKELLRAAGIPTPPWQVVTVKDTPGSMDAALAQLDHLPCPVFLKPLASGSSVGILRVTQRRDLAEGLVRTARHGAQVLVEQGITGVEVTLAVMDGEPFPLVEIQPPADTFFDFQSKYTKGVTCYPVPPERVTGAALERATRAGVDAYAAAGCAGLARVDIMMEDGQQPWVLEINTVPGMTATSLAPKAAQARGLSFEDLAETILRSASLKTCSCAS